MPKDQAIKTLRETLKIVSDYTLYCKSTVAEDLKATEDTQGDKQIAVYKMRIKSLTEQLIYHRGLARQYQTAISTLESERAANAILTKELVDVQEELNIPAGWKLVPIEPTEQIRMAMWNADGIQAVYKAILSAAPTYKEGE